MRAWTLSVLAVSMAFALHGVVATRGGAGGTADDSPVPPEWVPRIKGANMMYAATDAGVRYMYVVARARCVLGSTMHHCTDVLVVCPTLDAAWPFLFLSVLFTCVCVSLYCSRPLLGNGYVGVQVNSSAAFMAGVFNGFANVAPSHRAQAFSAVATVSVVNATQVACALDVERATYYRRSTVPGGAVVEQRWYASRANRSLVVMELHVLSAPSGEEVQLGLQWDTAFTSPDINFQRSALTGLWRVKGGTETEREMGAHPVSGGRDCDFFRFVRALGVCMGCRWWLRVEWLHIRSGRSRVASNHRLHRHVCHAFNCAHEGRRRCHTCGSLPLLAGCVPLKHRQCSRGRPTMVRTKLFFLWVFCCTAPSLWFCLHHAHCDAT